MHNENLSDQARYRQARELAANYIGSNFNRPLQAIVNRLVKAGYDLELAKRVADDLAEIDYVSDLRAAQIIAKRHSGRKAKGNIYLYALIAEKGISRELAQTVIESLPSEDQRLSELCASYKSSLQAKGPEKARRFLYSRGFPRHLIEREMESFFES